MSMDDGIELFVGSSITSVQLLQAFILSFAWIFDAQQSFISVFADARPTWHCTDSGDKTCSSAATPCALPSGSWAWDQPTQTSVVSEWALDCTSPFTSGLPPSAFFAGSFAGGLVLATLADSSLGRKKTLFFLCLLTSSVGILTAMSPNVWVYATLRFIAGFFRATINTIALVLSTETVGKKWRGRIGIMGFVGFTLGFLSLPAMAFLGRGSSWRNLYLWTSVPALLHSILIHFLVRESPRWLLVRGRREEAIQTLQEMSSCRRIPEQNLSLLFSDGSMETSYVDMYSALKMLVGKSWACRRMAAIMTVGFGVGTVYYGMPLAAGSLSTGVGGGTNLYLSVTFNALAEFPAALLTFFLVGGFDRKASVVACTTASGACSVLCAAGFVRRREGLRMGMEVVSFFSACTAFNVLLMYALELFPTSVRNSALSMVREAIVLGGTVAPVLVSVGRREGVVIEFGLFGLVIGSCGFFGLCLPETRGRDMCDTMEEEEFLNQHDTP